MSLIAKAPSQPILAARNVSLSYRRFSLLGAAPQTRALQSVSLEIAAGETLALLGRSGCGKSTLARVLVGLERPNAGQVFFEGQPLDAFAPPDWNRLRQSVQMVFQDPLGAVNPRLSVEAIIDEPLRHLTTLPEPERLRRVALLLEQVGLKITDAVKYPHQLSGGQLQRVCIARALATRPRLIVLDEAVSNLDLHLQGQMLELFAELSRQCGVAYLFITHDLRLVERFCTRVVVMERGRIVETCLMHKPLALTSPEGRALQEAVLPPLPRQHINVTPLGQLPGGAMK